MGANNAHVDKTFVEVKFVMLFMFNHFKLLKLLRNLQI